MTRLALIDIASGDVLKVIASSQPYLDLPGNAGRVSPLDAGWRGGGALTYTRTACDPETGKPIEGDLEKGQPVRWRDLAEQGDDRFALVAVKDAEIPPGHQRIGTPVFTYDDKTGGVTETVTTEPATPEPRTVPKHVVVDRLHAAGKLEAHSAALDAKHLYHRERWNALHEIDVEDPAVIEMLNDIGADREEILAE